MKIKVYLAMPFSILFFAITASNWPNLLIIIIGNSLCTVAYLSLAVIVGKENKSLTENVENRTIWKETVQKAEFSIEENPSNTVLM